MTLLNEISMYFVFSMVFLAIIVFVSNYEIPDKHFISKNASYTEGKECVINMKYTRDSHYISKDMSECLRLHANAINNIIKNY